MTPQPDPTNSGAAVKESRASVARPTVFMDLPPEIRVMIYEYLCAMLACEVQDGYSKYECQRGRGYRYKQSDLVSPLFQPRGFYPRLQTVQIDFAATTYEEWSDEDAEHRIMRNISQLTGSIVAPWNMSQVCRVVRQEILPIMATRNGRVFKPCWTQPYRTLPSELCIPDQYAAIFFHDMDPRFRMRVAEAIPPHIRRRCLFNDFYWLAPSFTRLTYQFWEDGDQKSRIECAGERHGLRWVSEVG